MGTIYHADFYRLNREEEAEALGLEEIFASGQPFWMEWPEKIPNLLPPETVVVFIEPQEDGTRKVTLQLPA
jgi:tRNA threonylcarbamoyladenosine biosynthesis protein TsaE